MTPTPLLHLFLELSDFLWGEPFLKKDSVHHDTQEGHSHGCFVGSQRDAGTSQHLHGHTIQMRNTINQAITKFKHKKRKNKWVLWTRWGWDYYSSEDPSPISRGTADHLMVLLQTCQNTHVPGKVQFLRFQEADLWLWWPCIPAGVNTCCCTTASVHWVIVWSTLWQTVQNVPPTAPLPLRTVGTCKPGCQECHISWGLMATWHQNVQSYHANRFPHARVPHGWSSGSLPACLWSSIPPWAQPYMLQSIPTRPGMALSSVWDWGS